MNTVADQHVTGIRVSMTNRRSYHVPGRSPAPSAPAAAQNPDQLRNAGFPPDVIVVAVRWYLRFGLSYRDVEELLVDRGIEVDHVTVYRWVQRFTPLLADTARPCRHAVGGRWQVDGHCCIWAKGVADESSSGASSHVEPVRTSQSGRL